MSLYIQHFTFSAPTFITLTMQRIEELWSSTEKRDHVRVLADMAHTIWQSNYFLGLHDSSTAFQ